MTAMAAAATRAIFVLLGLIFLIKLVYHTLDWYLIERPRQAAVRKRILEMLDS